MERYPEKYSNVKAVAEALGKGYKVIWEWINKAEKLSSFVRDNLARAPLVKNKHDTY